MKQGKQDKSRRQGESKKAAVLASHTQAFKPIQFENAYSLERSGSALSIDLSTPMLQPPLAERRERQIQGLLAEVDLTIEDFIGNGLSEADLEQLLYPGCTGDMVRWLTFDKTLLKILIYPFIKKKYLNRTLNISLNQPELEDLSSHYGPVACDKHHWAEYRAIPIQSQPLLRKIAGLEGFLRGTGFWTGQVWSLLLASFLANDLFLYYRYPEQRYGDSLLEVFTLQASNQNALANALTKPTVWPELVLIPLSFGLLQGLYVACTTRFLKSTQKEDLLQILNSYKPSFYQDVLRWCLPMNPLAETLDRIEEALLWDGTTSIADRDELFQALLSFNRRAKKFSQWKGLSTLANVADSLGPKDVKALYQAQISKEDLLALLLNKSRTLQDLTYFASRYQITKQNSRCSLMPLPRYLFANYLLWSLGRGMSYTLALPFWLLKASRVYSKGILLQTILLGITTIIIQYLKEQACKSQGKHWGYIPAIQAYNCTVCGDFPVFYRNSFTSQDCLWDFLNKTRNATDIIRLFERIDWREIPSLDLSEQITSQGNRTLQGRELNTALQIVKKTNALVEFIFMGRGIISLDVNSAQVLAHFINGTQVKRLNLQLQKIASKVIQVLLQGLVGSQVQTLELRYNAIGAAGAAALGISLPKTQVQDLDLSFNPIGDAGAEGLARGLVSSQVQFLELSYNHIGDAGAAELGKALPKTRMQTLHLSGNEIHDAGAEELARGLVGSQVKILGLGSNQIGDTGAAALGTVLPKTRVQNLDLSGNQIHDAGAKGLAQGLVGSQVQTLELRHNTIGDAGTAALGTVLPKTQVQVLGLSQNQIGDAGAEELARGLVGSQVKIFDLGSNQIGDTGAAALGTVLPKTQVQDLYLASNQIHDAGAEGLAQGLVGSQVQTLELRHNTIGDAGTAALGTVLPKTQVQTLYLLGNQIGDAGAEGLAQGLVGSQVQSLSLIENAIGDAGAAALGAALPKTRVQNLDLSQNQIHDAGAKGLARGLVGSQVQSLSLIENAIGDAGAAALGAALPKTRVQNLDLSQNQIQEAGAKELARGLVGSQVQTLDLSINAIGDEAATALGRSLPKTRVKDLHLDGNQIQDVGAEGLALGLPGSKLLNLWLRSNKIGDNGARAIAKALTKPQSKQHQLWINSFDTQDGKAVIFEPNTLLSLLRLDANAISDVGASALCHQLPATYIQPYSLYLSDNPNISASILANCGIITSSASQRYSLSPVLILKSFVWDTGILGAINLVKNIPTLFPSFSDGNFAFSISIQDITFSSALSTDTFYPPMPSATRLPELLLKPFPLITETLETAFNLQQEPDSQSSVNPTFKSPTMDLGAQLLLGQFFWHLGKKYSPFTLPWNRIRTISEEERKELLQAQGELQQQTQRFKTQERWLKKRNLEVERSEEIKHLKDTIALLQTALQQTLSSGQSSTTLLSDYKKALSTIKKQNDTLIVGDAPIPSLGSRLKQVYNYFTKSSSSVTPHAPSPSSKINKKQMKHLAIDRNRKLRRAEKTGKQVEVVVSRQLGEKLSQTFTNTTTTQRVLQFSTLSRTTQAQPLSPTFDKVERDLEKPLISAYGAGKLSTGTETGILAISRESKPKILSSI